MRCRGIQQLIVAALPHEPKLLDLGGDACADAVLGSDVRGKRNRKLKIPAVNDIML